MANLKNLFRFTEWWMNASAATFGTILGIVLTVGITYWQQMENQKEMTRKIAKITLHNIDVRINSLKNSCELLMKKDSIYGKLQSYMPDKLNKLPKDSLNQYLNLLFYGDYRTHDTKSEEIFSSSFEVWQFLDDEKVIGRISNCYSFLEMNEKFVKDITLQLAEYAFNTSAKIMTENTKYDELKAAKYYLKNPDVMAAYLKINYIPLIYSIISTVQELNEKNKEVLGINQNELDELSNLIGDDTKGLNYNIEEDSIQITRDTINKAD